jgi:hypothetical protein
MVELASATLWRFDDRGTNALLRVETVGKSGVKSDIGELPLSPLLKQDGLAFS